MRLFPSASAATLAALAMAGMLVGCNRDTGGAAGTGAGPATTPPPVTSTPPADGPQSPASAASR